MKTYWWKITVAAALVLAAVITARVFRPRPSESSIATSPARAKEQQTQQDRPKPSAEELYQTALHHKEPGDLEDKIFRLVASRCRQILQEYPDSPQAEKAKKMLQEMREWRLRLQNNTNPVLNLADLADCLFAMQYRLTPLPHLSCRHMHRWYLTNT